MYHMSHSMLEYGGRLGWSRDTDASCLAPSSYTLSPVRVCLHGRPPTTLTQIYASDTLALPRNLRLTRGACRARGEGLGDQNQRIAVADSVR
jgi:hypothetical protein